MFCLFCHSCTFVFVCRSGYRISRTTPPAILQLVMSVVLAYMWGIRNRQLVVSNGVYRIGCFAIGLRYLRGIKYIRPDTTTLVQLRDDLVRWLSGRLDRRSINAPTTYQLHARNIYSYMPDAGGASNVFTSSNVTWFYHCSCVL